MPGRTASPAPVDPMADGNNPPKVRGSWRRMSLLDKLKPQFWDHEDAAAGHYKKLFDFRSVWYQAVTFTAVVVLLPLIFITLAEYSVTRKAAESEILLRTSRFVSNTRRTVSFFLEERRFALVFIVRDNSYDAIRDPDRLAAILENLKKGLGGFSDLGVIDARGRHQTYVGPHNLQGKDYSGQEWFQEVVEQGHYISDVFLGYRQIPHLVIAVKHDLPDGSFYVLRASVDLERFKRLLSQLEVMGGGSAIIINREGVLQTPCEPCNRDALERIPIEVPEFSPATQVFEEEVDGRPTIVGYAYLLDTPFILMAIKDKETLMQPWYTTRRQIIWFLGVSVTLVLVVVIWMATHLVNNIYTADRRRVMALHEVEYSNKMASIGRMAAGVAHEINNPLQIIYEKAGLIKDYFTYKPEYKDDPRLLGLVDAVLLSVERCGAITKRVLSFARHGESTLQPVKLKRLLEEVLGFVNKEAEYRSISVSLDVEDSIPEFDSDRGKLQQIFLNLINNAFSFIKEGGSLKVSARRVNDKRVSIFFADTGPGIPAKHLERVFEPFFTTRSAKGGTGLGLSITYNLVQELGGKIEAESELGQGSTFIVTLPLKPGKKEA